MTQQRENTVSWNNVTVVSVDVDGTLYPVKPVIRRLFLIALWGILTFRFRMVFEELRSILHFYKHRQEIHSNGGDYNFEKPAHERNILLERTSRFMAHQVGNVGLHPGVKNTLERLKERGLKLVALSDHYSDAKLRALGVHTLFDRVYAAEETGNLKPHPNGFLAVCKGESIKPEQLLHIGDRDETDGVGARGIGAQALILQKDFPSFTQFPLPNTTPE